MKFKHKLSSLVFGYNFIITTILFFIIGYIGTKAINYSFNHKMKNLEENYVKGNIKNTKKISNLMAILLNNQCKSAHRNIFNEISLISNKFIKSKDFKNIPKKFVKDKHYLTLYNAIIFDNDYKILKSIKPIDNQLQSILKTYVKKLKNNKLESCSTNNKLSHWIVLTKDKDHYYYLDYITDQIKLDVIYEITDMLQSAGFEKNTVFLITDLKNNILYKPIVTGNIDKRVVEKFKDFIQKPKGKYNEYFVINDTLDIYVEKNSLICPNVTLYIGIIKNNIKLAQEKRNFLLIRRKEIFKFHLILTLLYLLTFLYNLIAFKRFNITNRKLYDFFKKSKKLNREIDLSTIHFQEFIELGDIINTSIKEIKRTQNNLLLRNRFLISMEKGLNILFKTQDYDEAIQKFIKNLSDNLSLDFVLLLKVDPNDYSKIIKVWNKEKVDCLPNKENKIYEFYKKFINEVVTKNKKEFSFDIKDENKNLYPSSMITYPILIDNKFWGIFIVGSSDKNKQWNKIFKVTISSFVDTFSLYLIKMEREENIKENNKFLSKLFNNLKSAVFLINEKGFYSFGNKAMEEITGYALNELYTKKFYDIVDPEFRELVKQRGETRLKNGNPISSYDFRIITKSGKKKWVKIVNDRIELQGQTYILGTAYDNDETYKALLREKIISKATNAIFTTSTIDEYIEKIHKFISELIDVKNYVFLLHNKSNNKIKILHYQDQFDDFSKVDNLDDKSLTAYVLRHNKPMLVYKKDIIDMAQKGEIKIIGTLSEVWMGIPFEIDKNTNAVIIIQNYENKNAYDREDLEFINLIIQDIAIIINEKSKELKIKESEEKYRTIFETANDGIFLMDKEKFLDCNIMGAKLFNCNKDDIIGKTPFAFSPKYQNEDRKILSETLALEKINAALNGKPQMFEWKHKKKTGEVFYCEVKLNTFKIRNKIYILAIVRDINERKMLVQNLRKGIEIMKFQRMEIYHRVMNNLQLFGSFYKLLKRNGNYSEETNKLLTFLRKSAILYSTILHGVYDTPHNVNPVLGESVKKIFYNWLMEKETKELNLDVTFEKQDIKTNVKFIFNSMVLLGNILELLRKKYSKETQRIQLTITLQKINDYIAQIIISDNAKYKLNKLEDLFDGFERKISFYLFSNPINAKIIYERRDSKNYFIMTFNYKEGNENG